MSIKVSCDSCGKDLKVRDEAAGKRVKCPDCGSVIRVPQAEAPEDAVDAESADDDDPWGGEDLKSSGKALEPRKPCPACGEMIIKTAGKCRFCGEILDPALKKKVKKKKRSSSYSGGFDDDDMSVGDWVVALICSGIGCIAGIVWMIQGKPKGTKMFLVSFGMVIVWNILNFLISLAGNQ